MNEDFKRISWLDSCNMPSRIHLTLDGIDTLCKNHSEYIKNRKLARSGNKRCGTSNYCSVCFKNKKHSFVWDERCINGEQK